MSNSQPTGRKSKEQDEKRPNDPQPPMELTGFQRDVLFTIVRLEAERPHGKAVKHQLEEHYSLEINAGRLYQNLRELTDDGLVETYPIDGRTKAYYLSSLGLARLEAHQDWIAKCLRNEDRNGERGPRSDHHFRQS